MTIQIIAPHFTAGVWVFNGYVKRAAPIVSYMIGWTDARVIDYAEKKGWQTKHRAEDMRIRKLYK